MKIDWKAVSQSVGYRSLKKAYIKDVVDAAKHKHPMRKKQEFLKLFGWVIARAKHYSVRNVLTVRPTRLIGHLFHIIRNTPMQIELFPVEEALPTLSDIEAGAEFLFENGLYIKHQKNGKSHFRVYLLNNKAWKSLPGSAQVRRVTITCSAKPI